MSGARRAPPRRCREFPAAARATGRAPRREAGDAEGEPAARIDAHAGERHGAEQRQPEADADDGRRKRRIERALDAVGRRPLFLGSAGAARIAIGGAGGPRPCARTVPCGAAPPSYLSASMIMGVVVTCWMTAVKGRPPAPPRRRSGSGS